MDSGGGHIPIPLPEYEDQEKSRAPDTAPPKEHALTKTARTGWRRQAAHRLLDGLYNQILGSYNIIKLGVREKNDMKNFSKLLIIPFLAALSIACGAFAIKANRIRATTVIDQSSIAQTNLGSEINSCCKFIAQTFTAGETGTLAGVSIDVTSSPTSSFHLHVAIRTVTANGVPSPTILGETTLGSGSAPITLLITFPETIHIIAGDQYAIIVNYEGAPPARKGQSLGMWSGASGDTYTGGEIFTSVSDGIVWSEVADGDFHFQTYVNYDIPRQ
jgi:hypothetical protein